MKANPGEAHLKTTLKHQKKNHMKRIVKAWKEKASPWSVILNLMTRKLSQLKAQVMTEIHPENLLEKIPIPPGKKAVIMATVSTDVCSRSVFKPPTLVSTSSNIFSYLSSKSVSHLHFFCIH